MDITLTRGNWEDRLFHAYTLRFPFTPKLTQERDCVRNGTNPDMKDGFDYTSLLTIERYPYNTTISATCSFEKFGAPLLLFTDKVQPDEEGNLWYGGCYEIVLFEEGINVWKHFMEDNEVKWVKLFFAGFPVDSNEKYTVSATLREEGMEFAVNEQKFLLRIENIPAEMHVGFTACEDINRFYSFSVVCSEEN